MNPLSASSCTCILGSADVGDRWYLVDAAHNLPGNASSSWHSTMLAVLGSFCSQCDVAQSCVRYSAQLELSPASSAELNSYKHACDGRRLDAVQASMSAALDRAQFELKPLPGSGVVVVCGSLHAVAEAQKVLTEAT